MSISTDGDLQLVAAGLQNPLGLHIAGDRLLVGDISGDFAGGRELPDGFIVEITLER